MTQTKKDSPDTPPKGSIIRKVVSFFTSVKTTILLLFLLSAASVIGTVVPQQKTLEEISATASPFSVRLIAIMDLNHLFQSWWFTILLALLTINLLACLFERTPTIFAQWKEPATPKGSVRMSETDPRPVEIVRPELAASFSRLMKSSPKESSGEGSTTLFWTKHRLHLFGFPLIHIGIVVVLVGGLVGLLVGFKGYVMIPEGQVAEEFKLIPSEEIRPLPFRIALDRFTLKRYPTGQPKEYRSDVVVSKDGRELYKGPIRVNHPLTYEGISLYQSDYRLLGIKQVTFALSGPSEGNKLINVEPTENHKLPDGKHVIRLRNVDPGTGDRGPGAGIQVQVKGEEPRSLVLHERDEKPIKLGEWELRFKGYEPLYATGLQVGYDPGASVVYAGCILLIIGFGLTLFMNHRRLWIELRDDGTRGAAFKISGSSRNERREFRESVEKTLREFADARAAGARDDSGAL